MLNVGLETLRKCFERYSLRDLKGFFSGSDFFFGGGAIEIQLSNIRKHAQTKMVSCPKTIFEIIVPQTVKRTLKKQFANW